MLRFHKRAIPFSRFLSTAASIFEEGKNYTPSETVSLLDQYIVGQHNAKKAVAVALRNRWRRKRVEPADLMKEITPSNVLLIGNTGVGKTEIARRIADLIDCPFVKTEATKFTEVGFHGANVEQIIKDLVSVSIQRTKQRNLRRHKEKVAEEVEKTLLELLTASKGDDPLLREALRNGELDDQPVEIEVKNNPEIRLGGVQAMDNLMKIVMSPSGFGNDMRRKQTMKVGDAKPLLEQQAIEKLVNEEMIIKEALISAQEDGIVFLDEIDKVCVPSDMLRHSGDASNEGVQRDLLPLIEGCTVSTKHGDVDTSKILLCSSAPLPLLQLFICSGAFHGCKVSDLLPELQGRLPVRVELESLTEDDMYRILTEPKHNLVLQHCALLASEGLKLSFTEEALRTVARLASDINRQIENIGARRLQTVLEKIVEEYSFQADILAKDDKEIVLTPVEIEKHVGVLMKKSDLSKFIL